MRNYITGHISAYKNEILCGENASFCGSISLIIRRWLVIVALVAILASFGGAWAGKGQTLPPGTLPLEKVKYRVYMPVIMGGER